MAELFLEIVNMSIAASWLVLAVLVLRLGMKKAPKWIAVLLWGIVAVRLLLPFSIESALSLIPSAETVSPEIMTDWTPQIQSGVPVINDALNPMIEDVFAPNPTASANPLQILIPVVSVVWLIGVAIMLGYAAVSYWKLHSKMATAIVVRKPVYQSEYVKSPFVLGIWKPKIYLPFHMDADDMHHVIAHEQTHIRRKDHWWKPIGFLLLTVHWFNPLLWVAYVLLCRDIELACDESVIEELDKEEKAAYTKALLDCSIRRRMISACPLAFGEVGVKERVKSVMKYKKPAFWVIVLSILICGAVAVCFLTDPQEQPEEASKPAVSDEQKVQESDESDVEEETDAEEVAETTYTYYSDGTVKEKVERNGEEYIRTQYREDGTIAFVHQEEADCTIDNVYDEAGKRTKSVLEFLSGKREEILYDSEERMISWIITDDGLQRTFEFSYYDNGNIKTRIHTDEAHGIVDKRYYNEDGSPASEHIQYFEHKAYPEVVVEELSKEVVYDADGNSVTKTVYRDGKIWETKSNAVGRRIWEKTTQPDGSTVEIFYEGGVISRYIENGEEKAV